MDIWLVPAAIVFFVLLSSFFTCSETALFSLSRIDQAKLKNHPRASCRLAAELLRDPQKLLTTILMGNEIADIISSGLTSWFFLKTFGPYGKWLAYPLITAVLFVWGDLFPKVLGLKFREKAACLLSRPLLAAEILLAPLRILLLSLAQTIFRVFGLTTVSPKSVTAEEEIKHLVEKAYLSGALGPQERLFIYSLFESEETPVSAIMTPRKDIFALEDQKITENLLHTLKEIPFHKIPIYREHLDKVVGILYVQDLLKARLHTEIHKLSELSRPAFFVPEKTRVRKLLEEFQRRRIKMALVVDEYGHISGLVTLEDVLEELFGEIYQARESKEPLIEKLGEGIYRVKGRVQIEDFNRETGAHLPAEGFRTMAGLALHLFQELPKEGDEAKGYGFRFQVEKIQKNRIESLIVERLEGDEAHL
ncbi:hemolysin family protein [Thermosulfurimonas dismutans]|uniref:Magnesium and cobalt efflux protein CorC n=1 Tax=Thermosulfurimonas dismutans TaxID=999894 RepID=A0A179D3A6_9BACT|nr:hemolysin family protein [Thermosulfurimonas dismutans]OAQ20526.1 hypothetical protein TDIS_1435 [Thermosulfurimonas dismutans]